MQGGCRGATVINAGVGAAESRIRRAVMITLAPLSKIGGAWCFAKLALQLCEQQPASTRQANPCQ